MAEKMDIKKLAEYRSQINSSIVEGISSSVAKLNDTISMIADLQRINEALVSEILEKEQELTLAENKNDQLSQEIENLRSAAADVGAKKKQYSEMELSMAKITALLAQLKQREIAIEEDEKKLIEERKKFKREKSIILSEKTELEEKAKNYQSEKNEAIKSRDEAIALKDWYCNYAIALDRKIVNCFRKNQNEELESHYYSFLNDPSKLDEIHVHFPDYFIEDTDDGEEERHTEVQGVDVGETEKSDLTDDSIVEETKKEKKEKKENKEDRP